MGVKHVPKAFQTSPLMKIQRMDRKIISYISLLIFLAGVYFIITGSSILGEPVFKGTDFLYGTLITWISLSAFPLSIVTGIKNICSPATKANKIFRLLFRVLIIMSALWGFVSFFLANNWNFIFESKSGFRGGILASQIFWIYTALCVLMPIILLISYIIYRLYISIRKIQKG